MDNIERAAQIWCHPKLKDRVMDTDMALVIADALRKAQDEAYEMAAGISDRRMRLWFGNIRIEKPYEHLTVREQFEVVSDAIRSLKSKGETK